MFTSYGHWSRSVWSKKVKIYANFLSGRDVMSIDRIIDLHTIIRLFQSLRHTLKFCWDLWKSQLNRGVLFGEVSSRRQLSVVQ